MAQAVATINVSEALALPLSVAQASSQLGSASIWLGDDQDREPNS
jgi:hypothetical protein